MPAPRPVVPARRHRGFTLIEFLIALVVIGFIVALLVNFFGDPLDDAAESSNVTRVQDNLREWATGARALSVAHDGECCWDGDYAANATLLIANGYMEGVPPVPEGTQVAAGSYSNSCDFMGGRYFSGNRCKYTLKLTNVTEAFCKAYNAEVHPELGAGAVVDNCNTPAAPYTCAGDYTGADAPAEQCGVTCCYANGSSGQYDVIYSTGIVDNGWW